MFAGSPGRGRLPPRRGEARDDRAGEGLVLGRLEHVRARVVLAEQRQPAGQRDSRRPRRQAQRRVVAEPTQLVAEAGEHERRAERACCGLHGRALRRPEPERDREGGALAVAERFTRRLHEVPEARVGVPVDERVRGVELAQPVTRGAGEPVRHLAERRRRVECRVHRLRVVAVRGVGRGDGIRRHQHRMAGRLVDRAGVRAAVAGPATAVAVDGRVEAQIEPVAGQRARQRLERRPHHDRVANRIGEVVGLDLVLAALCGRRDAAFHTACVERPDGVRHVAGLQVGERGAVGDDVLQRLDVRVVDGRVVDVAEDAVRDRVPDLGGRVAGGSEAVLARQVEVRERAGPAGRKRERTRADRRRAAQGDQHGRRDQARKAANRQTASPSPRSEVPVKRLHHDLPRPATERAPVETT